MKKATLYGLVISALIFIGSIAMMAFKESPPLFTLPVVTLSFPVKADMYLFSTGSDGQGANLNGETVIGDSPIRYYTWNASSMETDDGDNIIRPTAISVGNPGRYKKWDRSQKQANWTQGTSTALDYILNKPATAKKQETFSGTTSTVSTVAGTYQVIFGIAYPVAPNIQANIINGADNQNLRITAISTTGFTVLVRTRTDVVGLLPSWAGANGLSVDVLITEK